MVRFGVAGYPPAFYKSSYRKNRLQIVDWLGSLGLTAWEMQMTYGPRTSDDNCREYRRRAEDLNISLSIHASYYIVLTSADRVAIERSIDTLKRTFDLADKLGTSTVVLHPGPLYGGDARDAEARFTANARSFFDSVGKTSIGLFVETAGKVGQLGSVDEVLRISTAVSGCYPCIDFGHVHARTLGSLETTKAVDELFVTLHSSGSLTLPRRVHFHYTPIDYGSRGEIGHKALDSVKPMPPQHSLFADSAETQFYHPRFERIVDRIAYYAVEGTVVSETLNSQEVGALAMNDYFARLRQ